MRWVKTTGVILGALLITTLGLDAADTWRGNGTTLLGQLVAIDAIVCPAGMTEVSNAYTYICADIYEASVGEECQFSDPQSAEESRSNLQQSNCQAVSAPNRLPWRNITRADAQLACARAGKRLPQASEWYQFAIGTPDDNNCQIAAAAVRPSAESTKCLSASGVHDAIGNVWEWVYDDIHDGIYQDRPSPDSGYVAAVDNSGVAVRTSSNTQPAFSQDYFWSQPVGDWSMMRGGFYNSQSDAGLYAVHADMDINFSGSAVGFRCVR